MANYKSCELQSNAGIFFSWQLNRREARLLSDTLTKELRQYGIAEKLRALRLRKKMGLVELGRHTGLSAAMLSKIERGKLFPTLPTLVRVALVFSVGLEYFFSDERKRQVIGIVRRGERKRFRKGRTGRIFRFSLNLWISPRWSGSSMRTMRSFARCRREKRGSITTLV